MDALAPWLGLIMFAAAFALLALGFPVGLTLAGTAVLFSVGGQLVSASHFILLSVLPLRYVGVMDNDLLQAIPLFVYLGVILQRTTLAAELIDSMCSLFGVRAGGLAISTIIVGALLAPTTGAVGATVLTLGLIALPSMLSAGCDRPLACGLTCAAGTLGTVLPPSIILILLADGMRGAKTQAEVAQGLMPSGGLIIKDIYLAMLVPVAVIITLYLTYAAWIALAHPERCPAPAGASARRSVRRLLVSVAIPLGFIVLLLGSIITGLMYTVEAAALAAVAATVYSWARGELSLERLAETVRTVMKLTAVVFLLLIGASTFTLVFRSFGSDALVRTLLAGAFSDPSRAVAAVFSVVFCFGFFLDALEIVLLAVPIAMPPLLILGADPIWLSALMAVTVQTSFLIPPSGFAIFFLRGIAPQDIRTTEIYRGVVPFIVVQVVVLALLWTYPQLALWLPRRNAGP